MSSTDETKLIVSLEARVNGFQKALDKLRADTNSTMGGIVSDATAAERKIQGSTDTMSAALAKHAKSYGALSSSAKLSYQQQEILVSTFHRSLDSLVAGQSPMHVLIQQGLQASQAFGGSGLGGAMETLVNGGRALVAAALTPVGIAVTGVAAAVLVGTKAWADYDSGQKLVQVSLAGLGRLSGATVDDINSIAEAYAKAGDISVASARSIAGEFARAGVIGTATFGDMIAVTKNFATTTGTDVEAAAKTLGKAFSDPVKGAESLNAQLGFLSDKTREEIRQAQARNDYSRAQKILIDAIVPSLANAAQATSIWGRAWDSMKNSSSDALDFVGKKVDGYLFGGSIEEQIKAAERGRDAIRAAMKEAPQYDNGRQIGQSQIDEADRHIADLKKQLQASNDATAKRNSLEIANMTAEVFPELKSLDELREKQQKYRAALNDSATRNQFADLYRQQQAYDAVTHAVTTWISAEDRGREALKLGLDQMSARTPEQKADIASRRELLSLAGQEVTSEEANRRAKAAYVAAMREAAIARDEESKSTSLQTKSSLDLGQAWIRGSADAARAAATGKAAQENLANGVNIEARAKELLASSTASTIAERAQAVQAIMAENRARESINSQIAAGKISYEQGQRLLEKDAALRPLVTASLVAEGEARQQALATLAAASAAYDRQNAARARGAALQIVSRNQDDLSSAKLELSLVSASAEEREKQLAILRTQTDLKNQGITPSMTEYSIILRQIEAQSELNAKIRKADTMRSEIEGVFDNIAGGFTNALLNTKGGWSVWRDFGISALQEVEREMLKLALIDPLKKTVTSASWDCSGEPVRRPARQQRPQRPRLAVAVSSAGSRASSTRAAPSAVRLQRGLSHLQCSAVRRASIPVSSQARCPQSCRRVRMS